MDLDDLLRAMVEQDASDLYLTVGSRPTVNKRGHYVALPGSDALTSEGIAALARRALPPSEWEGYERSGDANAAYALPGSDRFRLNVFRQRGEPGMVVRRIRTKIAALHDLGVPAVLGRLVCEPRGLILVTGATGSGKSTTLAAMVDHRNASLPGHIVTLEDPIEFVHPHRRSLVTQREIGFDTPSYHDGLKNALRQAPSVLLIGEIRDAETATAALQFADTGHLVLATLHSTNANQTLKRLINLFPATAERTVLHQLSLNLRAVVSQRLLPRKDGSGRVAAVEVLINTPRVADLVRDGKIEDIKEAMVHGKGQGSQTFDAHILELYRAGSIVEDVAIEGADSANDMRVRLRMEGGANVTGPSIEIVGGKRK